MLHHPQVDGAVIGPRRPAHLDTAVAALDITLSDADAVQLAEFFQS